MHLYNPTHPFSDDPKRCIRRTIRDCRECPLSPSGCRFGRSGSSGFADGTRQHPFAAGQGGFVAGGVVDLTGFEDEGGLAVEADVKKLFKFF